MDQKHTRGEKESRKVWHAPQLDVIEDIVEKTQGGMLGGSDSGIYVS